MKTIGDLISQNETKLNEAGIIDARFDIIALLSEFTGMSSVQIKMSSDKLMPDEFEEKFNEACDRLGQNEPVAYITGKAYFYNEEYKVGPGVLIPRPDTEILVEKAIEVITNSKITNPVIWDLCTGSGCVGISLGNALIDNGITPKIYLVDLFDEALQYTRSNLDQSKCPDSITIVKLDVLKNLDKMPSEVADFIISNPPYITSKDMEELDLSVKDYEPHTALFGLKEDGLLFYEVFANKASQMLNSNGAIIVEHGYDQEKGVHDVFEKVGLVNIECVKDFGGNPRVTLAYGGNISGK